MDSIGSNDEKTVGRKSLWTVSLSYWGGGGNLLVAIPTFGLLGPVLELFLPVLLKYLTVEDLPALNQVISGRAVLLLLVELTRK